MVQIAELIAACCGTAPTPPSVAAAKAEVAALCAQFPAYT